jgi:uncharacterized metal-binding protein
LGVGHPLMPGGPTHDAITLLLAFPIGAAAYLATGSAWAAGVATTAFLFGGLIFGPDLDTVSRPYARWGPIRVIWFPYRAFFRHRSRLSHGIVLGALIRVVYFMGVVTLAIYLGVYAYALMAGGRVPGLLDTARLWGPITDSTRSWFGDKFLLTVFLGLWTGAASHTLTDLAGTFVKTGRRSKLF